MALIRRPRRPPRTSSTHTPSWHLLRCTLALALLSVLFPFATAQSNATQLTAPSTTTFTLSSGLGAQFYYPPSASTLSLTLSLCSPPSSVAFLPSSLPYALFASNSSDQTAPSPSTYTATDVTKKKVAGLAGGFGNVTVVGATEGLWVGVYAPDDRAYGGDGNGNWTFSLGLGEGVGVVTLDGGAGFRFDDTDQTNGLLTTANYSATGATATSPNYTTLFFPTTAQASNLTNSLCYLSSTVVTSTAVAPSNVVASTTIRGFGGGQRMQYHLSNLSPATNYTAFLLENNGDGTTRLWDPLYFATKAGTQCRLLYGLDFCPAVAYAVPAPPGLPTANLTAYLNATVQGSLSAFARTLTTFPCESLEFGAYSYASGCADCSAAYTSWLCATALPRCTDPPANATTTNLQNTSTWALPDSYQQTLLRDTPSASRTPYFSPALLQDTFPGLFNSTRVLSETSSAVRAEDPFPYSEVPPCLGVCQLVGARCPPFLGWACPVEGGTGTGAYGEMGGGSKGSRMAGEGGSVGGGGRAGDRWGNV